MVLVVRDHEVQFHSLGSANGEGRWRSGSRVAKLFRRSPVKSLMWPEAGVPVEVGEELMDAVTSLGASSPAFFLLFLEAMIDAGVKIGIPRDKAKAISMQVVKGTVAMLEQEQIHPTLMREMITSPGGTTICGLAVLEDRAFKGSVIEAIEESALRAEELSL